MYVKLLDSTKHPIKTMYVAARTCYSQQSPIIIQNDLPKPKKMKRLIKKVLESGHWSIAEHIYFTFAIEGISRACSHQLVRHRIAVYSQKSQRYVNSSDFQYVTPTRMDTFSARIELSDRTIEFSYDDIMDLLSSYYAKALEEDIPKEDARFILPNATRTDITMSCNFRELVHVYDLRACTRAQWEIRQVARAMKQEIMQTFPFLASFMKIRCEKLGYCPDLDTCGKYPLKKDIEIVKKNINK